MLHQTSQAINQPFWTILAICISLSFHHIEHITTFDQTLTKGEQVVSNSYYEYHTLTICHLVTCFHADILSFFSYSHDILTFPPSIGLYQTLNMTQFLNHLQKNYFFEKQKTKRRKALEKLHLLYVFIYGNQSSLSLEIQLN